MGTEILIAIKGTEIAVTGILIAAPSARTEKMRFSTGFYAAGARIARPRQPIDEVGALL